MRMDLDDISVITAVWNGSGTILDVLRSVAFQSYSRKEHVIQDGGSTDGTPDLVRSMNQSHIRLQSTKDSGVYDAFNRGLVRAKGQIVGFIGADDFYEGNGVLEEVASAFRDPSVEMVYGDALIVSREDVSKIRRRYKSGPYFGIDSLRRGFMPAHTATFVRRQLFDEVGGFDETYRIAGDFEWFARLFATRPVRHVYIPKPFVRMRAGGLSSSGIGSALKVTQEFRKACLNNQIDTSYLRLLGRFPIKIMEQVIRR